MQYTKFTAVTLLVLTLFFGYNKWVFSWGLFQLFDKDKYTEKDHEMVKNFNPEEDALYLPGLEDKTFFESVDDFSICRKKGVREFLYLYLTSGREYVIRSIEKSEEHTGTINRIFRMNPDIPAEIALLPLLESGFEPKALSRSNAAGLWQFLRGTSAGLGLKSDSYIDERYNIEKSTEAAIRHLRHLHRLFGSWELALAAYNGGEGQIARAIEKTGSKNIWDLINSGALARETSEYLPRYAALLMIYNNRHLFGIDDEITPQISEAAEVIHIKEPTDIRALSSLSGTDISILKKLNPELLTYITPPSAEGYPLRLPLAGAEKLKKK